MQTLLHNANWGGLVGAFLLLLLCAAILTASEYDRQIAAFALRVFDWFAAMHPGKKKDGGYDYF